MEPNTPAGQDGPALQTTFAFPGCPCVLVVDRLLPADAVERIEHGVNAHRGGPLVITLPSTTSRKALAEAIAAMPEQSTLGTPLTFADAKPGLLELLADYPAVARVLPLPVHPAITLASMRSFGFEVPGVAVLADSGEWLSGTTAIARAAVTVHRGTVAERPDGTAIETTARIVIRLVDGRIPLDPASVDAPALDPLADYSEDNRPAVLGGECASCLHRAPLHEPTCPKLASAVAYMKLMALLAPHPALVTAWKEYVKACTPPAPEGST